MNIRIYGLVSPYHHKFSTNRNEKSEDSPSNLSLSTNGDLTDKAILSLGIDSNGLSPNSVGIDKAATTSSSSDSFKLSNNALSSQHNKNDISFDFVSSSIEDAVLYEQQSNITSFADPTTNFISTSTVNEDVHSPVKAENCECIHSPIRKERIEESYSPIKKQPENLQSSVIEQNISLPMTEQHEDIRSIVEQEQKCEEVYPLIQERTDGKLRLPVEKQHEEVGSPVIEQHDENVPSSGSEQHKDVHSLGKDEQQYGKVRSPIKGRQDENLETFIKEEILSSASEQFSHDILASVENKNQGDIYLSVQEEQHEDMHLPAQEKKEESVQSLVEEQHREIYSPIAEQHLKGTQSSADEQQDGQVLSTVNEQQEDIQSPVKDVYQEDIHFLVKGEQHDEAGTPFVEECQESIQSPVMELQNENIPLSSREQSANIHLLLEEEQRKNLSLPDKDEIEAVSAPVEEEVKQKEHENMSSCNEEETPLNSQENAIISFQSNEDEQTTNNTSERHLPDDGYDSASKELMTKIDLISTPSMPIALDEQSIPAILNREAEITSTTLETSIQLSTDATRLKGDVKTLSATEDHENGLQAIPSDSSPDLDSTLPTPSSPTAPVATSPQKPTALTTKKPAGTATSTRSSVATRGTTSSSVAGATKNTGHKPATALSSKITEHRSTVNVPSKTIEHKTMASATRATEPKASTTIHRPTQSGATSSATVPHKPKVASTSLSHGTSTDSRPTVSV